MNSAVKFSVLYFWGACVVSVMYCMVYFAEMEDTIIQFRLLCDGRVSKLPVIRWDCSMECQYVSVLYYYCPLCGVPGLS